MHDGRFLYLLSISWNCSKRTEPIQSLLHSLSCSGRMKMLRKNKSQSMRWIPRGVYTQVNKPYIPKTYSTNRLKSAVFTHPPTSFRYCKAWAPGPDERKLVARLRQPRHVLARKLFQRCHWQQVLFRSYEGSHLVRQRHDFARTNGQHTGVPG